jgi:hypothetical protein
VLFEVTMAALIGDALIPGSLRQAVLHGTKASAAVAQERCPWQIQRTCSSEQEGARSMTMQLRRWRCGNALW